MMFKYFKVFWSYMENKIQSLILRIENRGQITIGNYTGIVDRCIVEYFGWDLLIIYTKYNFIHFFSHCR